MRNKTQNELLKQITNFKKTTTPINLIAKTTFSALLIILVDESPSMHDKKQSVLDILNSLKKPDEVNLSVIMIGFASTSKVYFQNQNIEHLKYYTEALFKRDEKSTNVLSSIEKAKKLIESLNFNQSNIVTLIITDGADNQNSITNLVESFNQLNNISQNYTFFIRGENKKENLINEEFLKKYSPEYRCLDSNTNNLTWLFDKLISAITHSIPRKRNIIKDFKGSI